ncbi:mediator of RNA polymerase II transcription subunit 25-like [Medicago truncatula]|uniref:mediator of RNA polymerase II transcription subunit 25-like n=1 Tax=Medicago truncatula TaxID=3880 RepID=UPI0019687437|nr:mediator of RNA polymerase II transcription subunit 25-like [Medicago truncatula]
MPQQEVESDMQPLENDATAAQQTASSAQSKYTRFWKGSLTELRQGQRVLITKLECSRSSSASKTLTTNWPSDMQIVRLISQERMTIHKQHARKEDLLVFRPVNPGRSLSHLKEKKLGAVIQLPSQTLLLFVSEKPNQLIGMFIPQLQLSQRRLQLQQLPQQQQEMQHQHQQNLVEMQQQLSQLRLQRQQLPHQQQQEIQQQHQQNLPQLQQQLSQLRLQHPQLPQQQQEMQQQHQQNLPQLLHQFSQLQLQQQMVGVGMGQTCVQGPGHSQMVSQGQVSSQRATNIDGRNFMS